MTTDNSLVVFEIDDNYRFVLWVALLITVQYFGTVMVGGSGRGKIFNQEFMEDNFQKVHDEELNGEKIAKGGYPDCGSGRYIMEAGYENWFTFMKNQRIHGNYME